MSQITPVVALRGVVYQPHGIIHTAIGRPSSIAAVDLAIREYGSQFLFLAQKDVEVAFPGKDDLYQVGTLSQVISTSWLDEERTKFQMLADTEDRRQIVGLETDGPCLMAHVETLPDFGSHPAEAAPLIARVKAGFERRYADDSSLEMRLMVFEKVLDPALLADRLANEILRDFTVEEQQAFLEDRSVPGRLMRLALLLEPRPQVAN